MVLFQVKSHILPHEGIIPGARGHKKITVPRGTTVYCIAHGTRLFWAAYLDEPTATKVARNLTDTVEGRSRRPIPLDTLLTWNFKTAIPSRISRPRA